MADGKKKRVPREGALSQPDPRGSGDEKIKKRRAIKLSVPAMQGMAPRKLKQSDKDSGPLRPAARKTHKHNGGYPETRADAGERTPEILSGQTYRLRNGEVVIVFPSGRDHTPWSGHILGRTGERFSWRADGAHGATWVGHELDIMGPAR